MIVNVDESEVHTHVQRNETLAAARAEVYASNSASKRAGMAGNLLFVYVDTMSRAKAYLKLHQTMRFFSRSEAYEMFKLHSFAGATFENAIGFMYGITKSNLSSEEDPETHAPLYKEAFATKASNLWDFLKA